MNKFIWKIEQIPELMLFPPEQRKEVLRRHQQKNKQGNLALMGSVVCLGIAMLPILWLVRGAVVKGTLPMWAIVVAGMADMPLVVAVVFLWGRYHTRVLRRSIRREFPEFCSHCAYCLLGAQGPNCPECGTPFDPTVPRSRERVDLLMKGGDLERAAEDRGLTDRGR